VDKKMKNLPRFVVVDDDPLNNALCQVIIKTTIAEAEVKTFTRPEKVLEYITIEYSKNGHKAVLLLDLNMPTMSAWEFLEEFDKLDEKVKNSLKIYILSSSLDPKDIERASSDRNVFDYIVKPLTSEIVTTISTGNKLAL
jgi:response regulator RpfG family c-di-GMP phosphodiesterase